MYGGQKLVGDSAWPPKRFSSYEGWYKTLNSGWVDSDVKLIFYFVTGSKNVLIAL